MAKGALNGTEESGLKPMTYILYLYRYAYLLSPRFCKFHAPRLRFDYTKLCREKRSLASDVKLKSCFALWLMIKELFSRVLYCIWFLVSRNRYIGIEKL